MRNRQPLRLCALILSILCLLSLGACKKKDEVKMSIPALFLNETEKANLAEYCEVNGFKNAVVDEKKDTVEIIMDRQAHELLLIKLGLKVMTSVTQMIKSETFPYFVEIGEYEKDFSEMTLLVNGKKYKADSGAELLPLSAGEMCLMYRVYTEEKHPSCKITVADKKSGEILFSDTYTAAK